MRRGMRRTGGNLFSIYVCITLEETGGLNSQTRHFKISGTKRKYSLVYFIFILYLI